jgi:hypothetical protein
MPRGCELTKPEIREIYRLRSTGLSHQQIAEKIGKSNLSSKWKLCGQEVNWKSIIIDTSRPKIGFTLVSTQEMLANQIRAEIKRPVPRLTNVIPLSSARFIKKFYYKSINQYILSHLVISKIVVRTVVDGSLFTHRLLIMVHCLWRVSMNKEISWKRCDVFIIYESIVSHRYNSSKNDYTND